MQLFPADLQGLNKNAPNLFAFVCVCVCVCVSVSVHVRVY